jgi:N-acetylmuramic acid 6-phosphate etherase
MSLHGLSVAACVELIGDEDQEVVRAMRAARSALTRFIEAVEPGFTSGGRLIYIGAGTSGRLGVLDASEAPPTFQVPPDRIIGLIAGGDSSLRKSSEGKEDDPSDAAADLAALHLTHNDTLLGIAAGGTTPYVLGALELAKSPSQHSARSTQHSPPLTALLVCSPIEKPPTADHLIILDTGPEVLTGSTRMKAGTATKLALNTISTTLMVRSGRVYQNLMVDLRATNDKLRDRAARIISTLTGLSRDAALSLLDQAGGTVKTAIVMHHKHVPRHAAEALLSASRGHLQAILGPTS